MRRNTPFKSAVGVVVAVALLWLLFRNTSWEELLEAIRGVDLLWLGLALGANILLQFIRVQRWGYIVRATSPAKYRSMFSATQIAFLVNLAIPARIGELVRAYTLARLEGISLSRSMALVTLDRMYDILTLLLLFLITLVSFPLDRDVEFAANTIGNTESFVISSAYIRSTTIGLTILFLIALVGLVILFVRKDIVLRISNATLGRISARMAAKLNRIFLEFAEGLHIFRSAKDLAKCLLVSLAVWATSLIGGACILTAFGFDFPWFAPLFILCWTAVFIAVPVTPGMIGQYHVAVVVALIIAVPEASVPQAKAVAVIMHLIGLVPVVVLGVFCLIREGITVRDLGKLAAKETTGKA